MRCFFTCRAEQLRIPALYDSLKGTYTTKQERNALHVEVPTHKGTGHAFYFSYGCIVLWGLQIEKEQEMIALAKAFEVSPLERPTVDSMAYLPGDGNKIVSGEIILDHQSPLAFFALSHAMAQSVKLDAYEQRIQKTIDLTKHIPQQLAKKGKVPLSGRDIRRKMGELFIERSSINLHFDVLDKPEFFWEYSEVEPLYFMAAQYLDIDNRVEVLNQRLGVIHELFEMLNNELNHKQSSRLEIVIIILILIEVFLLMLKDVLGWL